MMTHAQRLSVLLATGAAILLAGCTTIAPLSSPASPSAPAEESPAASTPEPTPSTSFPNVTPTETPTETPTTAPKTPMPVKSPTGPTLPNLVITRFTTSDDPVVVGAKTDGKVTIKNTGTADAGAFSLGLSWNNDNGLGSGADSPVAVDGLAAGDSVQVTVDLSLTDAGSFTFTAEADSSHAVAESSEDDNTKTLATTAVSLANLYFAVPVSVVFEDGGYDVKFKVGNSGTADASGVYFDVFAFDSAGIQTDLGKEPVFDPIVAGTTAGFVQGVDFPASGDYKLYVLLDPDNTIDESNENDNEGGTDVTVP